MRFFAATAILAALAACSGSSPASIPNGTAAFGRASAVALVPVPGPHSSPSGACDRICYYVDAVRGNDGNEGTTPQKPFRTLNKAAGIVTPGSTVLVGNGTYTSKGSQHSAALYLTRSGRPGAWIKFVAWPGAHPVIRLLRGDGAWNGIQLEGTAYILIDGFEIVGQNENITWADARKNTGKQGWLNETCIDVDGYGYSGFHPGTPHDIVIRNSIVHDCSGSGIYEGGGDTITIAYNRVYDNSWWTVYGTSGINVFHQLDAKGAGSNAGYRNFIVGNVSYGNHLNVGWIGVQPPAITDGNAIIIDSNKHQDGGGAPYTGRTYVANNITYGNGGRGVHLYASRYVDIVNNTAYNDLLSKSPDIVCGEIDADDGTDVRLLDNIGMNLNGKQVDCNDKNVHVDYDYNVWSAAQIPVRGPHDIAGNPRLRDPRRGDFTPLPGSPALADGTASLAPAIDALGHPRDPKAIDRGAIQVSP
jgi:parallel beta-helix repeat protein